MASELLLLPSLLKLGEVSIRKQLMWVPIWWAKWKPVFLKTISRNPAVIADLVGDNVGDCAGRGADLFESTAAENIGAMILGSTLALVSEKNGMGFSMGVVGVMMFPLVARAFGILASIVGILSVKLNSEDEDPMTALNRGYYISVILALPMFAFASHWLLNSPQAPDAWWHFFLCGVVGVVTSVIYVFITQYYTEYKYRPVRAIAEASTTGPATNIIEGTAVGFESTWMPVVTLSAALLSSYYLGKTSGLPEGGLFGTAVATMGIARFSCLYSCHGYLWSNH